MASRLLAISRHLRSPRPTTTISQSLLRLQTPSTTTTTAAAAAAAAAASTPRTMSSSSSSAPRTYEWLVVVPDKPGTLQKRIEVRPQHFAGLTKNVESGVLKMGGAILEDIPPDDEVSSMKFCGSTIIVVAESKEAALGYLKDDPYVKAGVWDLDKVMIWPTKIAFRKP